MTAAWPLPDVAPALAQRYRERGWWRDETLGDVVAGALAAHPEVAVRLWSQTRPAETTIGEVTRRSRALAGALAARGIGPGHVVAFQLPNWLEAVVTFYGVSLCGATLVPIVHFYGPREVGHVLRESGAELLVTADRFGHLDYLAAFEELRPTLADLETVVVVGESPGPAGSIPFDTMLDAPPLDEPVAVGVDAPVVIGYTSGTTAAPKGVVHSHRSLLAEIRQMRTMGAVGDRPVLTGAPVGHAIGMYAGLLLPLVRGQAIHLTDVWDPPRVLAAIAETDVTSGSGSTFFLQSLLDDPTCTDAHRARMSRIGLGGAPVPAAFADRCRDLGISIVRSYGSTEHPSTTGSTHDDPYEQRGYTDGRPLDGVELRLVDDAGRDVAPGTPGEILSRGPDRFAGYTDPVLTAAAIDADGWYATGDIGVLDEAGALTITDRVKDIIIRGGENISAAEVEDLLHRMPGVAEAAVVAAPDERLGEHACAFVRALPGQTVPDLAAVRAHCEALGLARQKWPEEILGVDALPRTPTGKVKKFELRARLLEGT
ncbi:MAG TPA: AMP-binding protein [Acidimicrobiia bacterium]|nr:AMP-binding protein [Acidimicrobiia bacterium]